MPLSSRKAEQWWRADPSPAPRRGLVVGPWSASRIRRRQKAVGYRKCQPIIIICGRASWRSTAGVRFKIFGGAQLVKHLLMRREFARIVALSKAAETVHARLRNGLG